MDQRQTGLVRLTNFYRRRQARIQHGNPLLDETLHDTHRQARTWVELVSDNAIDAKLRIVVCADFRNRLQQTIQCLTGEFIAVKRDQAAVCADERRTGEKIERGRCIDHDVIPALEGSQGLRQLEDLGARLELGLQVAQPAIARNNR